MSTSKKAAKSVLIIIIFSLGSKLLGFFREVLIASKFGAGMETDTYFVALTATSLLTSLIGTSINTTMIPVLSQVESIEGKEGKKLHTSNILNIVVCISFIMVALSWVLAPLIIKLIAHGFEGEQFKLAILLMRIGSPVMLFSGVVGVFRGYLQSELMFAESAASQFPFNFTYIFYLIFLSTVFGIKGLMVASVIAVGAQILIQIPSIRKTRYKHRLIIDIKDRYVRDVLTLIPPVLINVAVNDLNKIVDRALASNLVSGSISALNYSNKLKGLVLNVFVTAITTVIFPMLSKESNKENLAGMKKMLGYGINIILLITIPATIGMIVLSRPIVEIAFQRGAFDSVATTMTSEALIFYTVGLVAMALRLLLDKVYYSLQDTKTPMINGFIAVGFNIVLNLIFVRFMGHKGLALATSLATMIATGLMFYDLKRKIGSLGISGYILCGIKSLVASVVMGAVAYIAYYGLHGIIGGGTLMNLIALISAVALGVLTYLTLIYILKVGEIRLVISKLVERIRRVANQ